MDKLLDAHHEYTIIKKLYDPETSPIIERAGFIALETFFKARLNNNSSGSDDYLQAELEKKMNENEEFLVYLGIQLYEFGGHDSSVRVFRLLCKLFPKNGVNWFQFAHALQVNSDLSRL
jgi:hypothetical protein